MLGRRWLAEGRLDESGLGRFLQLTVDLRRFYARHIAVEEREVFPLAAQILPAGQLGELGDEMARRRKVTVAQPASSAKRVSVPNAGVACRNEPRA